MLLGAVVGPGFAIQFSLGALAAVVAQDVGAVMNAEGMASLLGAIVLLSIQSLLVGAFVGAWLGLYLFGLAADPGWWWTGVGFVAMLAMFVFASIPMLDDRSLERRPGYAGHMERVPALVPGLW